MTSLWFVYMLRCSDGTLYTGVTTDTVRRLKEHNSLTKAAKYTRVRQPVEMVFTEVVGSRSEAQVREAALKKLSRSQKLHLIARSRQKSV